MTIPSRICDRGRIDVPSGPVGPARGVARMLRNGNVDLSRGSIVPRGDDRRRFNHENDGPIRGTGAVNDTLGNHETLLRL